ncbi:MAG: outer membrane beta-barrel protein [bacterium]
MQSKYLGTFLIINMVLLFGVRSLISQEEGPKSRFSHRGLKAAIGLGSFEATSDRGLSEGDGGFLSLGYGITDRFSLWLTALGAEHPRETSNSMLVDFGGLELNLQHKFAAQSRLQPYGKIGVGVYGLQAQGSDTVLVGVGFNIGIGTDFFFCRHFGIGAELMFKSLDYSQRSVDDGETFSDLRPQTDGDSVGFMITFTIQ